MVKSIISVIIASLILFTASILEQKYITETFNELKESFVIIYDKIENDNAVKEDILSAQKLWISKKEKLHIFISHNEIKEVDLWIAETVTLVENDKKEDAISKIDVVIELMEQIPKSFYFRIENLL